MKYAFDLPTRCFRKALQLSALALLPFVASAQTPANPNNESRIYDMDILSVQLHLAGAPLTFPMAPLNAAPGTLVLHFDHLGTDIRDYLYTIEHCDANWQRSELDDNEFINGFTEDRIINSYNSYNTLQQYVHFSLSLPNANMRWTKSGNYLLKVYDNTYEKKLVLVRRFVVVEMAWSVATEFVRPVQVSKLNTHQEIDFTVSTKGTVVQYPQKEVQAFVLQNGDWRTAIGPVGPYFVRGDQLVFDYQDKIVFPAGKEWRYFDMRTFDYRGDYIRDIQNMRDYYQVTLQTDENWNGRTYLEYGDINGRFSIENNNANQGLNECDYAEVLFSFKQNLPLDNEDIYVYGELSDWQLKPEFKMRYEESVKAYVCEAYLKQGYYNYKYLVVNQKTGETDEEGFEGNWHETGNDYQILVYYRPFGQRYDRLMLSATMDSRLRN
ncbi:MAG: DUF5103 domain-containing protein [Saprospiraceae bacterium]|nr:DUF5103 domain-containing protein [Lewinellaceae bacterium]